MNLQGLNSNSQPTDKIYEGMHSPRSAFNEEARGGQLLGEGRGGQVVGEGRE